MIRRSSAGPSAMLKTTVIMAFLLAASAVGAQTPDVSAEQAKAPATAPVKEAPQSGFHDLICKPNGTEDGFDCADEATPARIVPIPSQDTRPLPQNQAITAWFAVVGGAAQAATGANL
jgi:hypothetical protein